MIKAFGCRNFLVLWLLMGLLMGSSFAKALTLPEYLQLVQQKNKTFLSLEASKEAASVRYVQGNLDLSPVMTASQTYLDDKSLQASAGGAVTHTEVRQSALGFRKKFSTGTTAAVQASVQATNVAGSTGSSSG